MDDPTDPAFLKRRLDARGKVAALRAENSQEGASTAEGVTDIYVEAKGDPAAVPWADLAPKPQLLGWLADNPGRGRRAIDIGCGLGDNAEAISAAGYCTTAFDLSRPAIDWARRRFPDSAVKYRQADLFDMVPEGRGDFDLVHECHTIQTLSGKARDKSFSVIADLVAPGGTLLVLASLGQQGTQVSGPPYPLEPSELARFEDAGLTLVSENRFSVSWFGREYPQAFQVWRLA
ncbi:methyltransferase domain-containing protein [Stappia sp. GBMRC 2046]|uniref:Methyltransferase domain-containing protein n=2 Tax=Stappia sediminis TaxID=2692190 RepID=A0A7X3S782_9HYPH|nr:methyltransferase domain-containing protein [Stappia sediminis]